MDMDLKQGAVRLNFHSYDLWKERTKQVLIREGLWRVIVNDLPPEEGRSETWIDKDERAAATIGFLVESCQLQLIKDQTWNILKDYHVKQSGTGRVGLIKKLCRLELEEDGNLEEHLVAMDTLFDKLKEAGCDVSEEMIGSFILASLPESYDGFVTVLEGQESGLSRRSLKAKLLNEYEKRRQKLTIKEEKAMKALSTKERKFAMAPSEQWESSRVCFECEKTGHIRKNCWKYLSRLAEEQKFADNERKGASSKANIITQKEKTSRSICFTARDKPSSRKWMIDSGASRHMTSNRQFFSCFSEQSSVVHLADGKETMSFGVGSGNITGLDADGRITIVRLKDVLYVPDLQCNLISVRLIAKSGAQVGFSPEHCFVKKNHEIVLICAKYNDVYWLKE